jgi:hypothetical protein
MAGDFVKALYLQSIVTVAQLVRSEELHSSPTPVWEESILREYEPEWVGGCILIHRSPSCIHTMKTLWSLQYSSGPYVAHLVRNFTIFCILNRIQVNVYSELF